MAIERVDEDVIESDEIGWCWRNHFGDEEQLVVSEHMELDLVNDNGKILHTIYPTEIDSWLRALAKARTYFVSEGIL